jgi:pimeloyl-ACP methyl ester carboxylesterase
MANLTVLLGRIALALLLTAAFALLAFLAVVAFNSSGKAEGFKDEAGAIVPGSIAERRIIEVNGCPQAIFVKGRSELNPILLYAHGGTPDYFLTKKYPTMLDELFTVVWWEQRGAGIVYDQGLSKGGVTSRMLMDDAIGVAEYLRQRFKRDKIFLMAHSGGTFFGIQVAAERPDLFEAYIAVAQIKNQLQSEKLAYGYIVEAYEAMGKRSAIRDIEGTPIEIGKELPLAYLKKRDVLMHDLGVGTMHRMRSVVTGLFLPSLMFREYTLKDKLNLWRNKARSGVSAIWDEMVAVDLAKTTTRLEIPVYFLSGVYDCTCAYELSKEYFEKIRAPVKGFYTFSDSAHSPIFEEPEKVRRIMESDVLKLSNGGADIK